MQTLTSGCFCFYIQNTIFTVGRFTNIALCLNPKHNTHKMKKTLFLLIVALIVVEGFSQDITTGLVARYSFCGNLNDDSGNENNGQYMGAATPQFVQDVHGAENSAMFFNGFSDWVNVASSETIDSPVEEATVSCWVNYQSLAFGQWVPIFAKTNTTAVLDREYSLGINASTGQIYWHSTYVAQSDELELNTWFHITVTYTPEMLKCYLNGEFIGEAVPVDPLVGNEEALQIGRDTPVSTDYFHGVMDEVNVFNRALTAADVMALKNYNGCGPSAIGEGKPTIDAPIYPNPTTGNLSIDLTGNEDYYVSLFNAYGQEVMSVNNTKGHVSFDLSALEAGFYFLRVQGKSGSYLSKKIIKR